MYRFLSGENKFAPTVYCETHQHWVPLVEGNKDYQKILDDIIDGTAEFDDGVVPAILQEAADAKKFKTQLEAYKRAVTRLSQYVLSEGQEEVSEQTSMGVSMNPETGLIEEMFTTSITTPKVDPLPEMVSVIDEDGTEQTVRNPLIIQDEEERAAAQAIVDATPQEVKDAA